MATQYLDAAPSSMISQELIAGLWLALSSTWLRWPCTHDEHAAILPGDEGVRLVNWLDAKGISTLPFIDL